MPPPPSYPSKGKCIICGGPSRGRSKYCGASCSLGLNKQAFVGPLLPSKKGSTKRRTKGVKFDLIDKAAARKGVLGKDVKNGRTAYNPKIAGLGSLVALGLDEFPQ